MLIFLALLAVIVVIAVIALLASLSVVANRQKAIVARRRSATPAARRPHPASSRPTPSRSSSNGHAPTRPITSTPHRPFQKIYGPDRIGIVGFHDAGFVIAVPAEPYADWLQARSQRLHEKVGGKGTNLTDGLRKAVEMLQRSPRGVLRRIWLLTDGHLNREESGLAGVLQAAKQAYINVNTIGFGDAYDESLLKRIAGATHNGKFVPVQTLRELTEALLKAEPTGNGRKQRHQSETTVLVIDLSPSMNGPMENRRKVGVVEEAVLRLLHYKRECFA